MVPLWSPYGPLIRVGFFVWSGGPTPNPLPKGKGSPRDDRGLYMALDCGFRRNDGVREAIGSRTNEHLPQSAYGPPAVRGEDGRGVLRPYGEGGSCQAIIFCWSSVATSRLLSGASAKASKRPGV